MLVDIVIAGVLVEVATLPAKPLALITLTALTVPTGGAGGVNVNTPVPELNARLPAPLAVSVVTLNDPS
jgi:hypothetical protein